MGNTSNKGEQPKAAAKPRLVCHDSMILAAFDRVEAARIELHEATRIMMELIRTDPLKEWPEKWEGFMKAGGVTVDELCEFNTMGEQIRPVSKQQRHLRVLGR
jgi:hypothetical protein